MKQKVYLNGEIIPREKATIDIEDRGYQFADGVYEVIAIYQGKPFKLTEHLERLVFSAAELEIECPPLEKLEQECQRYLASTDYSQQNGKIYLQLTRGVCSRTHAYPDGLESVLVMKAGPLGEKPESYFKEGVKIIIRPDERWSRCYVKSIALLPNIMAKKEAKREAAYETVMERDGFITEGSSANVFIVEKGTLITPPATNYILKGITRQTVIEDIAPQKGLEVKEESIALTRFLAADEIFLTGTTTEVMPVIQVNDKEVAKGQVGDVTQTLYQAYRQLTRSQ